ncbi:Hachiman antiphage defense system protein HamA [Photobacterium leiognathi]|uniref:Hachiman antiphage defense system protein HamA n=1 Tax=Photobacterium leiognathi TaxID=553611 RepID=UPI002980A514|nr:Hachiman antiphage defense system protein HamA [Photobacterium leiognathi]
MTENDVYSLFKLGSVHLVKGIRENTESVGTCFAISKRHVVTAKHVVGGYDKYYLFTGYDEFIRNKYIELSLKEEFDDFDFAILEVTNNDINLTPVGICDSISLSKKMKIEMCGYPSEKLSHATVSTQVSEDLSIVEENKFSIEILKAENVKNYKRMSGSPILYKGYAIGILVVQSGGSVLYGISFKDIFNKNNHIKTVYNFQIAKQEEVLFTPYPCPDTPLKISYTDNKNYPNIDGLSINYEFDGWEEDELINSSTNWLIDYSLNASQRAIFEANPNYFDKMRNVFINFDNMSENNFSNLLLHKAIRKNYKTIPIVNSVTTLDNSSLFSCSHVVINNGLFEIWLGVSIFECNLDKAIKGVTSILSRLLKSKEIKERLILINEKTDPKWPFKNRIEKLGDNSLSIVDRVDKIIIPVFISHDSNIISNYNKDTFDKDFSNEVKKCKTTFAKVYPENKGIFEIKIFHFPARCTETLNRKFEEHIDNRKKAFL